MASLWYVWLAIALAIVLIRGLIAWITSERAQRRERDLERDRANVEQQHLGLKEEEFYRQWLMQRLDERTALEKERVRIQNLSPKAFAQLKILIMSALRFQRKLWPST
jgi:hypothetical protein